VSINPLATFDCLYLGSRLQRQIGGFSAGELHLFSYLACLLSLYNGQPQANWGYAYVGTELGAPFSVDIHNVIKSLLQWGYFIQAEDRMEMSEISRQQLAELSTQQLYENRLPSLKAAGASTLAFSIGTVREAMGQEPQLHRAKAVPLSRNLLEDTGLDELYSQFAILREALGAEPTDLRSSAVTWLTALFTTSQENAVSAT
jgi:hypothetical protein